MGKFNEKGLDFLADLEREIAAASKPDPRLERQPTPPPVVEIEPQPSHEPAPAPEPAGKPDPLEAEMPTRKRKHVVGHRERLRERFRRDPDALPDYELLELVLFQSIPQRDTKVLAKELLERFGSFSDVCAASVADLTTMTGISQTVATNLQVIRAAGLRMQKDAILNRPILSSWQALMDYVRSAMQFQRTEDFRVLYLDRKNRLIADLVVAKGTIDRAPVYPREILKRVLSLEASALILVHNHPTGDPTPSHADIEMTKTLVELCTAVDAVVHDHLVVGREQVVSFKTLGLL